MFMIFPTANSKQSQAGVTLLLAILILAAITAIAFSLAAITTIELRSSGDVLRTEPALYGAQAVTEEAFFKYSRAVPNALLDVAADPSFNDNTGCQPASIRVCNPNNVVLSSPLPTIRHFDSAPRVDVIPTTTPSTPVHYLFFDPLHPGDFGQVYNSVTLTIINNVTGGSSTLTRTDGQGNTTVVRTDNLFPNTPLTLPLSSGHYDVAIQNSNSFTPLLLSVDAVKASAVNGSTHWIPLLNTTVDITANYLGLTRKYTITVSGR